MALFDDDEPPTLAGQIIIGEDLERFSRDELAERIATLKNEIARLEQAIAAKSDHKSAAESIFKN